MELIQSSLKGSFSQKDLFISLASDANVTIPKRLLLWLQQLPLAPLCTRPVSNSYLFEGVSGTDAITVRHSGGDKPLIT
jgi:hypothetical protein